jgi:CobQ-like glutamine amidotransferase family enzyme
MLPKNPAVADFLITQAIKKRYGETLSVTLDDSLAYHAREIALKRPR